MSAEYIGTVKLGDESLDVMTSATGRHLIMGIEGEILILSKAQSEALRALLLAAEGKIQ